MIRFPNAKINLGLRVLSRRQDGYHDIDTIMLPIGLYEALEVITEDSVNRKSHQLDSIRSIIDEKSADPLTTCLALANISVNTGFGFSEPMNCPIRMNGSGNLSTDDTDDRFDLKIPGMVHHFVRSGIPVPGDLKDDLVLKAHRLLNQYIGKEGMRLPPVSIHLHKCIPPGSGLGGGSSDAVFMLRILAGMAYGNKADSCRIKNKLLSLAFKLGSDCPFFLYNEPAQVLGRGEIVKPVNIPALKQLSLVLIIPPLHISTSGIFHSIRPHQVSMPLTDCIREHPENWKDLIINDFESIVFRKHPTIKKIKERLYREGAIFSSMSGTGSAVYGLFRGQPDKGLKKALQLEKNVAFLLLSIPVQNH